MLASGLAAGLVAGCGPTHPLVNPSPSVSPGTVTSPSGGPSTGTPSPGPSQSNQPGQPGRRPPGRTTPPTPIQQLETHEGTVTNGVEPSCLILKASDGSYELLGGDKAVLRPNTKVIVQGYRPKGLMSHCMQGILFQVTSAKKTS
ncbi:hypothetical protein [Fodinicola feengrottensis]|uniref:hypothetical protein n=1 Tax=Fodinicola feengrottensis TaxID=435914 RepID=UPI0013D5B6CB|nr:hypothetical protein [Fodinicola feengrottensis]